MFPGHKRRRTKMVGIPQTYHDRPSVHSLEKVVSDLQKWEAVQSVASPVRRPGF